MAERLNSEPGFDFSHTAEQFEELARGIKARQRGLSAHPAAAQPPAPPEEIWISRFGYRAISGEAGAPQRMALEAHGPVSFRPAPRLPDLGGLRPVVPETMLATAPLPPAPLAPEPVLSQAQTLLPNVKMPMRAAPEKRTLLARLFGRS